MPIPNLVSPNKMRTVWTNFAAFAEALKRTDEHLSTYIKGELCCEGNIGGERQLVLKAKVEGRQIEKYLKQYIGEYVKCPNCKTYNTIIKKDQATRLQYLYCESCKSEKTIQNLKPVTKGKK